MKLQKDELNYCSKVLGHKDRRLVFGSKKVDVVKSDFIDFLSEKSGLPLVPSTSSTPRPSKKRKRAVGHASSEGEGQDFDSLELEEISLDLEFEERENEEMEVELNTSIEFSKQGSWVVVAYDEDFFIGQVIDIASESTGTVQFMSMGYNKTFKWPRSDDIDVIDSKFVFCHDFEVITSGSRGRMWSVPDLAKLEIMYQKYKGKFMVPS
ncbi:hypothetical protein GQR58_012116 [Nymphon striatum]|nr:hypothetical protein GQR58_012116 [Nymphon striatum]